MQEISTELDSKPYSFDPDNVESSKEDEAGPTTSHESSAEIGPSPKTKQRVDGWLNSY